MSVRWGLVLLLPPLLAACQAQPVRNTNRGVLLDFDYDVGSIAVGMRREIGGKSECEPRTWASIR